MIEILRNPNMVWKSIAIVALGLGIWTIGQIDRSTERMTTYLSIITTSKHNDKTTFCSRNPYMSVVETSHDKLQLYRSEQLDAYAVNATTDPAMKWNHKRFLTLTLPLP